MNMRTIVLMGLGAFVGYLYGRERAREEAEQEVRQALAGQVVTRTPVWEQTRQG